MQCHAMAMCMGMPEAKAKAKTLARGGKVKPSTLVKPILDSIAGLEHPNVAMQEAELN